MSRTFIKMSLGMREKLSDIEEKVTEKNNYSQKNKLLFD